MSMATEETPKAKDTCVVERDIVILLRGRSTV